MSVVIVLHVVRRSNSNAADEVADSSVSSLIRAGWHQEGHPSTENSNNPEMEVSLEVGCLPYAAGKQPAIPTINRGRKWMPR